uniref:Uncharacterized protein n=1 Tax=Kalanchoe fedtschenkoi TaxID=63787 RepID=A0A7N0SZ85_KALFE
MIFNEIVECVKSLSSLLLLPCSPPGPATTSPRSRSKAGSPPHAAEQIRLG